MKRFSRGFCLVQWVKVVRTKESLLSQYVAKTGERELFSKMTSVPPGLSGNAYVDGDIYYDEAELQKIDAWLAKNIAKISGVFSRMRRQGKRFVSAAGKAAAGRLAGESDAGLGIRFDSYIQEYLKMFAMICFPISAERVLRRKIEEEVAKRVDPARDVKGFQEALGALAFCPRETGVAREKKELLEIALEIERRKAGSLPFHRLRNRFPGLYRRVSAHARKYAWTGLRFLLGGPRSAEWFFERAKELAAKTPGAELAKMSAARKADRKRFAATLARLGGGELARAARLLGEDVFIRDHRLECINRADFAALPLLGEISVRMGASLEETVHLTPPEVLAFLEKGVLPDLEKARERMVAYASLSEGGRSMVASGKDLVVFLRKWSADVPAAGETVRGLVACGGKARGKACLIHSAKDLSKMREGMILVTEMTTPDFVPAMEKAAAMVADLGGATSHTAIISRELRIPCIVGTHNATKSFKDGDLVEVDADNGVARKIRA